ncbi:MAG: UDP-4-amino-4,6-dideoxy-N-acetyl-beta-L-altrosamine transaminase [Lachnospiraceae bacterium]|nr:UDP-4-amino-4,6-dideoxy-N-acetyl-beta-L-altrosamine transaminase [Lachnospiraceae bacterium]
MIPYSTQCIEEDDIKSVADALRNEYLTGGPTVEQFESSFAKYTGAKYAVAVSSGTAALHIACMAIGLGTGDEVITTPNTWVSSANVAFYCGAKPVFADIDNQSYNIDPSEIERKITNKTRIIIAVDYSGRPCDMDRINDIAKEHGIFVIEDAAHSIGALYKGRKVGALADITTFSFHPVKQMTTCEGGMITTDSEELYNRCKFIRAYGMVKNSETERKEGPWFSDQQLLGYNYRLSDVQCSLGISQLKKVNRFIERRKEIANIYFSELSDIDGIMLPAQDKEYLSSFHLFPVLVEREKRKALYLRLREEEVGVGVHYYPVYRNTYYQNNGYNDVICPVAENFYDRELSLPVHYRMTDQDVDYIVHTIRRIVKEGC